MSRFSTLKGWFRGGRLATLVLFSAQIIAAASAFLINILAAQVLTPTDRGDLAFALQIAYFLTVFAVMGLERPVAATREGEFYSEYRYFTRLLSPGVIIVIPATFLVSYYSPLGDNWPFYAVMMIAVYAGLNTITRGVRVAYLVSRDWRKFSLNAIISQLILIAGAVILVGLDSTNPATWIVAYIASTFPPLFLLSTAVAKSKMPENTAEERKELRRKGWTLLPSDFSNTAMMRTDRLLLPILATSAELGLYVTVATMLEVASWPVKQWVDASLRDWSKMSKDLIPLVKKLILNALLLLILASSFLGLAAYFMVTRILPDSYEPALSLIFPLAVASIAIGMTRIQQGLLISFGSMGSVSVVEVIGTVIALVAYLILIPTYGMMGAAYGSIIGYSVCYVLGAVFLVYSIRKKKNERS